MVLLSAESSIDAALPPWAQGITLLSLLLLICLAFLRDWVVTRVRHERELELERKISGIHEASAQKATENNDRLITALDPVLKGNEAILKIVTDLQDGSLTRRRTPR